jgi:quinol monooxygenase YgiN
MADKRADLKKFWPLRLDAEILHPGANGGMRQNMIREVAEIAVKDGTEAEFVAAVEKAVPIFRAAKGCSAMRLEKVVETPGLFRLIVLWETLEDHTVTFRGSEGFQAWRGLVGPFFAQPPRVDHSEMAVAGFGEA